MRSLPVSRTAQGASIDTISPRLILALILGIAVLQLCAMLSTPVGIYTDDCIQILLAKSLLHGSFSMPNWANRTVTDVMPGLPVLLMLPYWLMQPHWGWFRLIELMSVWTMLYFSWRLAREALPIGQAAFLIILLSLNPLIVKYSGALLPDIPYVALSMFLFWRLSRDNMRSFPWTLAAGCALANLMRPFGFLLTIAFSAALCYRIGIKRAAFFAILALLPLAAWVLRNYHLTSASSGYVSNWHDQVRSMKGIASIVKNVLRMVELFFGAGVLVFAEWPGPLKFIGGLTVLALTGVGLWRSLRKEAKPWQISAAIYIILLMILHATWGFEKARYVFTLLPLIWIFIFIGLSETINRHKQLMSLAFICIIGLSLFWDASIFRNRDMLQTVWMPETIEWIQKNTPPSSHFQAFTAPQVMLMTGRPTIIPPLDARSREKWFKESLHNGTEYVVTSFFTSTGYTNSAMENVILNFSEWVPSFEPMMKEVYRNDREYTRIYRMP